MDWNGLRHRVLNVLFYQKHPADEEEKEESRLEWQLEGTLSSIWTWL